MTVKIGAGGDGLVLLFNAGAEVVDHGDDAEEQAQGEDVADDVDEDLAEKCDVPVIGEVGDDAGTDGEEEDDGEDHGDRCDGETDGDGRCLMKEREQWT